MVNPRHAQTTPPDLPGLSNCYVVAPQVGGWFWAMASSKISALYRTSAGVIAAGSVEVERDWAVLSFFTRYSATASMSASAFQQVVVYGSANTGDVPNAAC
jgi:hypothetical protein